MVRRDAAVDDLHPELVGESPSGSHSVWNPSRLCTVTCSFCNRIMAIYGLLSECTFPTKTQILLNLFQWEKHPKLFLETLSEEKPCSALILINIHTTHLLLSGQVRLVQTTPSLLHPGKYLCEPQVTVPSRSSCFNQHRLLQSQGRSEGRLEHKQCLLSTEYASFEASVGHPFQLVKLKLKINTRAQHPKGSMAASIPTWTSYLKTKQCPFCSGLPRSTPPSLSLTCVHPGVTETQSEGPRLVPEELGVQWRHVPPVQPDPVNRGVWCVVHLSSWKRCHCGTQGIKD